MLGRVVKYEKGDRNLVGGGGYDVVPHVYAP